MYDPVVNADSLHNLHRIKILKKFKKEYYDLIIVSVPHKKIKKLSIKFLRSLGKNNPVIIDIKSLYQKNLVEWQL